MSLISDGTHETRKVDLLDRHTRDQVEHFQVSLTIKYCLQCSLFFCVTDILLLFTLDMSYYVWCIAAGVSPAQPWKKYSYFHCRDCVEMMHYRSWTADVTVTESIFKLILLLTKGLLMWGHWSVMCLHRLNVSFQWAHPLNDCRREWNKMTTFCRWQLFLECSMFIFITLKLTIFGVQARTEFNEKSASLSLWYYNRSGRWLPGHSTAPCFLSTVNVMLFLQ